MLLRHTLARVALGALLACTTVHLAAPEPAQARITKELKEEVTPFIEQGLKSEDPETKQYAILAAARLKDRKLDKDLKAYLASTNTMVRRAAIVAFAGRKDRDGLKALDKALNASTGGRFAAMSALLPQLPEAVQVSVLKPMISGRKVNAGQQADALRYIATYGQGKVYALMELATKARKDADRKPFVKALMASPRPESLAIAKKLFKSREPNARRDAFAIAQALGGKEVDVFARSALEDKDDQVRKAAVAYLSSRRDPSAFNALLAQLEQTSDASARRDLIGQILGFGLKVPLDKAKALLNRPDSSELASSYYRLYGATQSPEALAALTKMERSTKIEDRIHAVEGLAFTKSAAAVSIFTRTAFDGHEEVRMTSLEGLGQLGMSNGVETLNRALNQYPKKDYQRIILTSLGQIKHPDAARALMFKTTIGDPELKSIVFDGLANLKDAKTVPVIENLARDRDEQIRWRATMLLFRIDPAKGFEQLDFALQRPPDTYVEDVLALPTKTRDAVLTKMLAHKKESIRQDTMLGLDDLGSDALPHYRRIILDKANQPKDVYTSSLEELLRHQDPQDVNLFKRLTQTGTDDEKMLALGWLTRGADASRAPFFRTVINGAKTNLTLRLAAINALLTAES